MAVRDIRILGDSALRVRCEDVASIDDEIRQLVDDLTQTMYAADGIGLAAPQVGIPLRVFVYDVREPDIEPGVVINPRIVEAGGTIRDTEGCLSIPGVERDGGAVRGSRGRRAGSGGPRDSNRGEGTCSAAACSTRTTTWTAFCSFDRLSPLKRRLLLGKWAKMDESEKRSAGAF